MKNSILLMVTIVLISLASCKKDAIKPTAQPPVVKAVSAVQAIPPVKTQLYDYQKAILVKRTIVTN